jgi:hypothetical protein
VVTPNCQRARVNASMVRAPRQARTILFSSGALRQ